VAWHVVQDRAVMFGGVTVLFVAFAVFSVANRLLAAS
jgi:hypothetical protein